MTKIKYLITGGCSFSDTWYREKELQPSDIPACVAEHRMSATWPIQLQQHLNVPHYSTGKGGQGNGLISRKVMYAVQKALRSYHAEDLLVGIMWSGADRWDMYLDDPPNYGDEKNPALSVPPQKFVDADIDPRWTIINPHLKTDTAKTYYEKYHSEIGHQIYTLENILKTQLFLKNKGIKFFMTVFSGASIDLELLSHPECKWLSNEIDWTTFIPLEDAGMMEWTLRTIDCDKHPLMYGTHPSVYAHEQFTKEVIIPWLIQK